MECKYCHSTHVVTKIAETGPHYAGIWCLDCGRHLQWISKPDTGQAKRRNAKWYKKWREYGPLICHWCGIKETETDMGFEIDHIVPIEEGGPDIFENTRPLCSACHWLRNTEKHRVKYLKKQTLKSGHNTETNCGA